MYSYFDELSPKQARNYGYFGAPGRATAPELTPEQRDVLMSQLGARSVQTAELLFDAIDTPASYLRDVLSGQPLGSRSTPGQMLEAWNLRPSKEALGGWGRPLAEFGAGSVLDPLNLVGIGSVGKAGQAAKAIRTADNINLLDDASRVMSRRLLETNALDSYHARNALQSWSKNFGKQASDLTDADLLARPIAGTREARRNLTLRDLVEDRSLLDQATGSWKPRRSAAEQAELISKIEGQGKKYSDIADQTLRQDIGIGLPFSDANLVGTNIPGGEFLAKGFDRMGQAARWSGPMRQAYATFDKDMFGAVEEGGQIVGKEVANAIRKADADSGMAIAEALQDLKPDVLADEKLAASMRRILGGYGNQTDLGLVTPGSATFRDDLKKFVDDWAAPGGLKESYLARRMDAGLPSSQYASQYSGEYFPRHVDDLSFQSRIEEGLAGGRGGRGGRAFSTLTPDQIARQKYLDVPGGEDFINRLGLDPNVAGPNRALQTVEDAAKYISKQVEDEVKRLYPSGKLPSGQPVPTYSMARARKMADFLSKLDETSIKEGLPIFGSHFTDDFARYIKGNERALAISNTLTDLMAGSAKNQPARLVRGGKHIPLRQVAKDLGLRTVTTATPGATPLMMRAGIEPNLLARLSKRFPGQVNELKNFSLDERMAQRLTRIADFYDYPEVQKGWIKAFDDFTRLWKGSILAFPARFTRDWYSGGFSNAVEVGIGPALSRGYEGAQHLIQGDMDRLDTILALMPRYRQPGMDKAARLRKFQSELAAGGLLGGRRAADFADTRSSLQSGKDVADEFLPGMNPRTTLGYQAWDLLTGKKPLPVANTAYSELGKNWDRFFDMGLRRPRDIGNPILRWSQKLGDTTDSINRAAGYMGLLLKGVDPLEAAARMKAAHVDYSSLTKVEREFFRRFIPFWSFTSRIGKWVATKVWEKPGGRFAQFGLRAPDAFLQTENDEYVPESIRSSYGMPISPSLARPFGRQQEGATPWVTKIALPGIQELNMFRLGFDQHGTPELGRTLWNTAVDSVGRMAHPAVKSGVEAVSGINLFTNRPYKEFTPAINEIAQELGIPPDSVYGQYIRRAAPFVDLIPFVSRPMQIANRLLDAEKVPDIRDRAYQMFLNATTGLSVQNVTPEQRSIDARREIGDMLRDDPLVRAFTQPYIPEQAKPYADPRLLEMMALERTLGTEANEARAIREGRPLPTRRRRRNTDPMSYFE